MVTKPEMERFLISTALCAATSVACIGDIILDPQPPRDLTARPGNAQVTLSWTDVTGATSYNLYWTDDGSAPSIATGNRTTSVPNPFIHTELTNGLLYRYVVTALNAQGESRESNEASTEPGSISAIGPTTVSFTLCCADCCEDFSIGYALWIEDDGGNYIDTVVYYDQHAAAPGYANAALPLWSAAAASLVDGISEASKYSDDSVSYIWDGTDRAGSQLARGSYTFKLEITDWSPASDLTTTTLELGDTVASTTNTNPYVAGNVTFDYLP
jgi:hypothetical protein